jgi:3-deoxy-D-manno-octulosonic-acid transferase
MKVNPLYRMISRLGELVAGPILERLSSSGGRKGEIWEQRLGHLPPWIVRSAPFDLWIHGVSVGEISVVQGIVKRVREKAPDTRILVSSFTETGIARAEKILKGICRVIAYPLDLPGAVHRTVSIVRPRVYACVETELWPNLLSTVRARGAGTLLLNARISPKSFKAYRGIKALIAPVVNQFDGICAISDLHAARLRQLGADPAKLEVTGNAKFELLLERPDTEKAGMLRRRLGIPGTMKVIVFGSLRGREHQMIMPLLKTICRERRDVFCVVAPRHLGRVEDVERALETAELSYQLLGNVLEGGERIDPYSTDVLLVDRIGFLFDLYGLSTCAFVGGSLVKKGGQNIMEPAAWKKPVIFGPHTYNFEDASSRLLSEGGGLEAKDADQLLSIIRFLLDDEKECARRGELARKTLEKLAGNAATRQAERILELLEVA